MTEACPRHRVHTQWPYISVQIETGIEKAIGICMTCENVAVTILIIA
jgi:hypothetical protein